MCDFFMDKNLQESKSIDRYDQILKRHGIELDSAELLEWVKGIEQLANLTIAYEKRRNKPKGQDPPS